MKCQNCGSSNPKTYRFCKECGEALSNGKKAAPPAAAGQQPVSTVIIREAKKGRSHIFAWVLVGIALVVLGFASLVWLDVIDAPQETYIRLPAPLGYMIYTLEVSREPGDSFARFLVNLGNLPAYMDYRDWVRLQRAVEVALQHDPGDICEENIEDKFMRASVRSDYYTQKAYIDFVFSPQVDENTYRVHIVAD